MWKAVAKPFMNIEKIHPHQQEAVGKMVELCKQDPNIKRVVIFGSSVRDDCRPDSDIDIYYELNGDKGKDVILLHGWGQNIQMMKMVLQFSLKH